jgi:ribonuclease T2
MKMQSMLLLAILCYIPTVEAWPKFHFPWFTQSTQSTDCQIPNQAESYVLAVSWQAEFCQGHQAKAECKTTHIKAYQDSHFTLHGLWPNVSACGINYGFCGDIKQDDRGEFCKLPAIPNEAQVDEILKDVMPGAGVNESCLERHEFYKHGSCQSLNSTAYFGLARELTQQFNDGLANFLANNIGKPVAISDFLAVINQIWGRNAGDHLSLSCDKAGNLAAIDINLPKDISPTSQLNVLLALPTSFKHGNCARSFVLVNPAGNL